MARSAVATEAFDSTTEVNVGSPFTQLNDANSIIRKSSGEAYGSHGSPAAAFHSSTLADDQYASLELAALTNIGTVTSDYIGVIARASADTGAGRDYYACKVGAEQSGGTWRVILEKTVNGSITTLNSEFVTLAVGDRIEIECIGTTIRGCLNGALINANFSVTDSDLTTGKAGIMGANGSGTGQRGDDLEIGDITADATGHPASRRTGVVDRIGTRQLEIGRSGTFIMRAA